ncbi:MAG TPA: ABC transporter permease [Micromonosporaceae bacterium]|nr:ABC transporter permease [Micromonosporaceae bacterium]
MRAWWVALRLARREIRRARGRTALVVAMIGLPVLALSFLAATVDMYNLTPAEKVGRTLGAADGRLQWVSHEAIDQGIRSAADLGTNFVDQVTDRTGADILALLPPGSRVAEEWSAARAVRTVGGIGTITSYGLDATDPLTAGIVRLDSGRLPRADDEVAVSPAAARRIGVGVGGTLRTVGPDAAYRVVGIVEIGGDLGESVLFRPDQLPVTASPGTVVQGWLVGQSTPLTWPQIQRLNANGIGVVSRALALDPPPPPAGSGIGLSGSPFDLRVLVVGLAMIEVVLLAGPAFAVGSRRRRRELALVAANGGTPAVLRRIVLADGIVCGAIAAGAGLAAGVGLAFSARSLVEEHLTHTRLGADRIYGLAVVGLVVLSVGTGLLAALVPAFVAGHQDVVAALAGRRGVVRSRKRWLFLGIAVTAAGAMLTAYGAATSHGDIGSRLVLGGLAVGELGLVLCTPSIVGLVARLGRFLPLAPRIALRDVARRRAAAAPAISAVMAAVAGSVAITIYLAAQNAHDGRYVPSLPVGSVAVLSITPPPDGPPAPVDAMAAAARAAFPGAAVVPVRTYACATAPGAGADPSPTAPQLDICGIQPELPPAQRCPYSTEEQLSAADQRRARADARCSFGNQVYAGLDTSYVTDDPAVVAAATGLRGTQLEEAVATLRAGGALVSDARYLDGGKLILGEWATRDGATQPGDVATATVPAYLVTTGVWLSSPIIGPHTAPGLPIASSDVGVLATPVLPVTQAEMDSLDSLLLSKGVVARSYLEQGDTRGLRPLPVILAIAAGLIALGAAGIATGLSAADSRGDLATLAAVGAAPRTRRVLSLAQAGVVSGLGAVLGALAGTGAAFAVLTGLNAEFVGTWPAPPAYPLTVPWMALAVCLLATPLVAMAGAGLLTRSRLPSERRAG